MRKGGGKSKGAAFERKVCEDLSHFISPSSKKTLFWRSAMSGGRATVRNKVGIKEGEQAGDLTCIHKDGRWFTGQFVIECKFHKTLDIQASLIERKGRLVKFWRQVAEEAKKYDKNPLLIAKGNRTKTIVLMDAMGVRAFVNFGQKLPPPILVSYKLDDEKKPVWLYDYKKTFRVKKKLKRVERAKPKGRVS